MLEIKNVSKKIDNKSILQDINIKFSEGKIAGITGDNGCGKTMLFNCIAGLINIDNGDIIYTNASLDVEDIHSNISASIGKKGYIDTNTVAENLADIAAVRKKIDAQKIDSMLKELGIYNFKNIKYGILSLGTKQKVDIAQVLMEDSKIYILDEPFNGLDENSVAKLRSLLYEEKKKGKIIIITSHIKEDIEILCDEIYEMVDGKLVNMHINENLNNIEKVDVVEEMYTRKKSKNKVIICSITAVFLLILATCITYYTLANNSLKVANALYKDGKYTESANKINKFVYVFKNEDVEKIRYTNKLNMYWDLHISGIEKNVECNFSIFTGARDCLLAEQSEVGFKKEIASKFKKIYIDEIKRLYNFTDQEIDEKLSKDEFEVKDLSERKK